MTTTIGNKKTQTFYGLDLNPSTAMHALRRDADGNLIYSRVSITGNETIQLSNGRGPAFDGMEEFVKGVTPSGVEHNTVPVGIDEIGRKAFLGKDYHVRILNPNTISNSFEINEQSIPSLDLVKGATYKFIVTDPSTANYPLYISTVASGANYNNEWLQGVTNSRASYVSTVFDTDNVYFKTEGPVVATRVPEPLTFTVPSEAPDVLYLSSGNHANLYITLYINRLTHANLKNRFYDQVKWDDMRVTYYINSDGYLVARYNENYSY